MPRVKRSPVWLTDEAVYRGAQAAAKAAGESVTRWATARLEEVLTDGHPQGRRWAGSGDELLAAGGGAGRGGARARPRGGGEAPPGAPPPPPVASPPPPPPRGCGGGRRGGGG